MTPSTSSSRRSRVGMLFAIARLFATARLGLVALLVAAIGVLPTRSALGCPFCSAVSLTFAQEIAQSQAAVIAKLVESPKATALAPRAEGPLPKGKFQIVEVLKGGDLISAAGLDASDAKPLETIMLEEKPVGTLFLLMGVEPPNLVWSSPVRVSDRAVAYIKKLPSLPEKGAERLAFFQEHLEDEDDTLARDAYDEFAIAPYADVRGLKSRMDAKRLMGWIENPKVQANRRRLYATMLGVCGSQADAERIGTILAGTDLPPDQAEVRSGLDALIACYVTLRGPEGLDLVDRLFLHRQAAASGGREVPFAETYAAVMALRFLGEETEIVPRPRVLQSLRLLLEEPKLADLVIADLARWQDWSAVDKLVELFKTATADNIFVREPIVNYLRACPLPAAAAAVKELEKIDPEAVRRAATLAGLAAAVATGSTVATGSKAAGGTATPTAPGTTQPADDDGGKPPLPPAAASSAGDDAALAKKLATTIAPVLADEEATDAVPGADPNAPPQPATPPSAGKAWRWGLWAAVVLAVAILSRAALRSGGPGSVPQ